MSTTTIPDRTLAQRRRSLDLANDVRVARAALRRELHECANLAAARKRVAWLLADPPDWLATMPVGKLLAMMRGFSNDKAHRLLTRCMVSHSKTVGGLSARQRHELIEALDP